MGVGSQRGAQVPLSQTQRSPDGQTIVAHGSPQAELPPYSADGIRPRQLASIAPSKTITAARPPYISEVRTAPLDLEMSRSA